MPDWRQLTAPEVLTGLQQLQAAGQQPVSGFLDTHQFAPLLTTPRLVLDGGHPAAQFRRAALDAPPAVQAWSVAPDALPAELRSARQLRAWLQRELGEQSLGDIHWGAGAALATTEDCALDRLLPGAQRRSAWPQLAAAPERVSLASARLDAAVATLFRVSRQEAQTAIEYGFVFLDFTAAARRTAQVQPGAQLVFRTKGRVELLELAPNPRSGRLAAVIRRYPA